MKVPLVLLCTLLCCPLLAHGSSLREIELTDGSTLRAEVLSLEQGIYRLQSETLGEVKIPEHRIKTIRTPEIHTTRPLANPESGTAPLPSSVTLPVAPPSADSLQQAMMQDPVAMEKIRSLQRDPLVQSIFSDPDTMQAIQSGNFGALVNDSKIKALMDHPTVQELGQRYGDPALK